jgi:hypothetical protein
MPFPAPPMEPLRYFIETLPIGGQLLSCLPNPLHPVSRQILDTFLSGLISEEDFLINFHLPNSDYLPVARCILKALAGS